MKSTLRSSALILLVFLLAAPLADASQTALLRILAYNIRHGEGTDGKLDLQRVAQVITQLKPDLVTLQEVDRNVRRTNRVDQASKLGELTGMHAVFGEFMDYQGGQYGMALLSRFPIQDSANHRLPPGAEPRSALSATVRIGESRQQLVFVGIHLYRTEQERFTQAARLVEIFKDQTSPIVLAGDFNSRPNSKPLNLLGRYWHIPSKGKDRLTFSSVNPAEEIDYIMLRPKDGFEIVQSQVMNVPVVSDHRPVLLVVRLRLSEHSAVKGHHK